MTITSMHRLLMAGLALSAGANHKRGTWRRIDALPKSAGATPTPKKPWQRASDQQVRLRDLCRPCPGLVGRNVGPVGVLGRAHVELASPKRDQRRALEAAHREHTGRELSPRQYVKLRKALARAAREQARAAGSTGV